MHPMVSKFSFMAYLKLCSVPDVTYDESPFKEWVSDMGFTAQKGYIPTKTL